MKGSIFPVELIDLFTPMASSVNLYLLFAPEGLTFSSAIVPPLLTILVEDGDTPVALYVSTIHGS